MRYGSKVLFEEVTTAFHPGRRYGLTGPNGAGKSTFMKLLTGELPPQRGTRHRPGQARRPQAGPFRPRPVPRHRYRDHGQPAAVGGAAGARRPVCEADPDRCRRHAAGRPRADRRRRGRLHRRKRCGDSAAGPRHPGSAARAADGRDPERTEGACAARTGAVRIAAGDAARRADQQPRPGVDSLAPRVSRPLRRHADRHLARSALPELGVHAHRRHRLPDDHHLHRRV